MISHCMMKITYFSFITSELPNNNRKHNSKPPLSRSAYWREVDMIGDVEQFIKLEDVLSVHEPHIDKKTEDRTYKLINNQEPASNLSFIISTRVNVTN